MFWSALAHLVALLFDLFAARRQLACAKDLEIAVLRHQLRVALRRQPQPRLSRWEQFTLALLVTKLRHLPTVARRRWTRSIVLVTPETGLRWHRDLVRRKWNYRQRRRAGRRPSDAIPAALTVRLATENPRRGYARIHGELGKLGHTVGRSTIRAILKRQGVPPTPRRAREGSSWWAFLARHKELILACDFVRPVTIR